MLFSLEKQPELASIVAITTEFYFQNLQFRIN